MDRAHLGEAGLFHRLAHAVAPAVAVENGGFDQARHRTGRGITDGNGLDDIVALEHISHAVEEFSGIDLRTVAVQHAFDKHHQRNGRGDQNQPDHRAAVGQKRWQHVTFIGRSRPSSKRKMARFTHPRRHSRSRNRKSGDENGDEEEFFPRHSSLNLYSPSMEKPDQLRELFRRGNKEETTSRRVLKRRVG